MAVPISIVITTYNQERYLSAAIASILAQTRRDFELLVWDDGSTDGSVEVARHYAHQDERVRVVATQKGRSVCLNQYLIIKNLGRNPVLEGRLFVTIVVVTDPPVTMET
jgi:glycosyltransferase involved in cell wall biosynthesis